VFRGEWKGWLLIVLGPTLVGAVAALVVAIFIAFRHG
jgi:hypothetical protein